MSIRGLIEKAKSQLEDHLVLTIAGLLLLLLGVVWSAIPAEALERVLDTPNKKALWALLGILLLLSSLLFAWTFTLRKDIKGLQAALEIRLIRRLGILWDQDLVPCCPACEKPLSN